MRKFTLLMLWLIGVIAVSAGKVTELEALKIAQQYMLGKSAQQKQLHRVRMQGVEQFHVFNAEAQGGFVIVSGDDRTMPVLGYSDHGSLDYNNLPTHVKAWLDGYVEQIKSLDDDNKPEPHRAIGYSINPLITCHWNQGDPYNSQCPMDGSSRSVTGCVATAMAQVMYYHKWPHEVPALDGYVTSTKKINVSALSATTFQWDDMKNNYAAGETGASVDAMAKLMRYCGQAVHMDYTSGESGSNVFASDLINIFGYSKTAKSVKRADYTTSEWEAMIYKELANERPVLYAGASDTGGHQFVIDGYDNNGLFHVNWGWGGYADGYFVLSVLNPNSHGIGGGTSPNGYAKGQDAIIGIQPDNDEEVMPDVYEYGVALNPGPYSRSSINEDFSSVVVQGKVACRDKIDCIFDHAWAICQNGQIIDKMAEYPNVQVPAGKYVTLPIERLSFGKGLEDGTYELRQLYRLMGSDEWKLCGTSGSIILAKINGTELTLKFSSEVESESTIKVNSVTLQGDKKEGRPMTLVMNWTNNGYLNENTFYVYLGSVSGGYVASSSSYVAPGETGDFEISFALRAAGPETIIIKDSRQNVIYTEAIDVAELHEQKLSVSGAAIEGSVDGMIKGTSLDAKATFTNVGDYEYDDNVIISMQPLTLSGGSYHWVTSEATDVVKPLSLQKGEKKEVQAHFTDLVPNQLYGLIVYYYSKNDLFYTFTYSIITTGDATPETLTISVGDDGLATYCPEYGVDFSNATGIAAYKASVIDNYVTLTKVDTVAAGEGVLIRSLGGGAVKEELPIIEDAIAHEDNAFVGVLETTTLNETDGGDVTNFVLSKKNDVVGFYKANNTPIAAGKAYLPVVNYSAASMSLGMTFGDTTGIREIEIKQPAEDDATYTLGGVRVKNPTKGIYIKNGKKVVVK